MALTKAQKTNLKELGLRLKSIRNAKGLTLKELGYEIDKDPQSISRVEMGDINPSYLYLLEISVGLKIDIKILVAD
jgi:transcriptional regulator with XRE-family HTH domain